MSIDKFNPKIFNCSDKTRLSQQDIEKLKDFVRINCQSLHPKGRSFCKGD